MPILRTMMAGAHASVAQHLFAADHEGNTPLMRACENGHEQAVEFLLEKAPTPEEAPQAADVLQSAVHVPERQPIDRERHMDLAVLIEEELLRPSRLDVEEVLELVKVFRPVVRSQLADQELIRGLGVLLASGLVGLGDVAAAVQRRPSGDPSCAAAERLADFVGGDAGAQADHRVPALPPVRQTDGASVAIRRP